ncbi:adenylate/guanylate cyclase domain-containing protein [Ancylobacter terrae]|uniref:adenylate/guanylate cyclase domain-containing protein n=1 Tax=Ancylobacter sp. sgz301288 TaxID=3342077 RepID=UPI003858CA9C
MAGAAGKGDHRSRRQVALVALMVAALLAGLPVTAWLDLTSLSEQLLRRQADEIGRIIDDMRNFYANDVIARVVQSHVAVPTSDYKNVENGIPIPATLSIELGRRISQRDADAKYRFASDYPFPGRDQPLDDFERGAITTLRADPSKPVVEVSGTIFDRTIRVAGPVKMGQACVSCHNSDPRSPKKDWKVGDVRGIQEITISQPIAANIFSFKYSMAYFAIASAIGLLFIRLQHRQAIAVRRANNELTEANDFLAGISMKIAKYLPPQIYKSIFSGQRDAAIATERKKLTIFFSDIVDFTATTERLQPEDLTALLNEYFTEMSTIALRHGATIDKFIGDAMLVFFGDPETKGAAEDARACLIMAVEMQHRLAELNAQWRSKGIEKPFQARMGINTGYCNVGNFGSDDRMDYTIIGAEANLAARLQSIAGPGQVVLSYETFALVRDVVRAYPLPPITMKGISREVVPYRVDGLVGEVIQRANVISGQGQGVELFLDLDVIDEGSVARTRRLLEDALAALKSREGPRPA